MLFFFFFGEGHRLMEMSAHSLAAGLTCWAAGPHVCGSKAPSFPPHRFKEWKFSWPCGLWLGLSTGRNLVVIGKGIITSSMFMETSNLNTCNKFCSVQKRNNVGYTSDVFIERSFFLVFCSPFMGLRQNVPCISSI